MDISTPANPQGYQANASVGEISVKTNGDLTINLGSAEAGWEVERYYS